MNATWKLDLVARVKHNEGYKTVMYYDSMGIPTIGVGFNLTRDDANHALTTAGVSADQLDGIRNGSLGLSDQEVTNLLNYSIDPVIAEAPQTLAPGVWALMSPARQAAICDMLFNLGYAGFRQFAILIRLINNLGHYLETKNTLQAHQYALLAGSDLLGTEYARQVGARAHRNAEMLSTSNYVPIDAFEG